MKPVHFRTHLSHLPGVQFILEYRDSKNGLLMRREVVAAFRREPEADEINYQLILVSPATQYNQNKIILAELKRSWVITSQPK